MSFESWALVEIMGHNQIAGKVSEETIAGVSMLRVDVPATDGNDAFTKFYSAAAIYSLMPCDEATARLAAEQFAVPPLSPYILRMSEGALLAEKANVDDDMYPDGYENEESQFDDDPPF